MTKTPKITRNADGTLPAYAWPGGYPIRYHDEDGGEYCPSCANQTDADPPIVGGDVAWEGPADLCGGCGKLMETAYGDPDDETEPMPREGLPEFNGAFGRGGRD